MEAALDCLGRHFTIQTSFETSFNFASLARASASELNLTRTLNEVPARSTYVVMKPWSIAFAARASAVFWSLVTRSCAYAGPVETGAATTGFGFGASTIGLA